MNDKIFYFFYDLAHKSAFLDNLFIFLANTFPYVVIMLAGLFLLFHHEILRAENPYREFLNKWKEIAVVFLSGVLAWIFSYLLKLTFQALRPFDLLDGVQSLLPETGYAFPSGHASFFAAIAFSVFFLHRKAGYAFMVFALLIGLSRIVSGVHFPADILGGFLLGALVAYSVKNV